jgi:hypothetical protein
VPDPRGVVTLDRLMKVKRLVLKDLGLTVKAARGLIPKALAVSPVMAVKSAEAAR